MSQRQIAESVLIQETQTEHLINSKLEWDNYSNPRLTVEREAERNRALTETERPVDDRARDRVGDSRRPKRRRNNNDDQQLGVSAINRGHQLISEE